MATYQVQKGETLGGIAQKLKIKPTDITGYRSGNPNLIYPGETLKYPDVKTTQPSLQAPTSPSAISPTPLPTSPPIPPTAPVAPTPPDYRQQLADVLKSIQTGYQQMGTSLAGQPSYLEQYKQMASELGMPAQQTELTGIQKQVAKTEDLLNNLESDINARVQGTPTTEAVRRRMLAAEESPLRNQLSQLLSGQNVAQAGYDYTRQQLSDMLSAQQQDIARQKEIAGLPIQEAQAEAPLLQQLGKAPETVGSATSGYDQYNPATGKWEQVISPTATPSNLQKEYEYYKSQGGTGTFLDYLKYKKGAETIPKTSPSETMGGMFTKKQVSRLENAGLTPDIYENITKLLLAGTDLDTIRQLLTQAGEDPKLLDAYDRAVGIESIRGKGGKVPPKSSAGGFQ